MQINNNIMYSTTVYLLFIMFRWTQNIVMVNKIAIASFNFYS